MSRGSRAPVTRRNSGLREKRGYRSVSPVLEEGKRRQCSSSFPKVISFKTSGCSDHRNSALSSGKPRSLLTIPRESESFAACVSSRVSSALLFFFDDDGIVYLSSMCLWLCWTPGRHLAPATVCCAQVVHPGKQRLRVRHLRSSFVQTNSTAFHRALMQSSNIHYGTHLI